jgi:hypothetical protein
MNVNRALLGLALFLLSGVFILSAFVVRSLRDRHTGGRYPRMVAFILLLFAGACFLIASLSFLLESSIA